MIHPTDTSSWYLIQQSTRLCMRPETIGEHNVVIDRWYKYVDVRWKIMALKVENGAANDIHMMEVEDKLALW